MARYRYVGIASSGALVLVIVFGSLGFLNGMLGGLFGSDKRWDAKSTFIVGADGWTILRNRPGGLAIGNARVGWAVDGLTAHAYGYAPVFVEGDFNGCAWTAVKNLKRSGGPQSSRCAHFRPTNKSLFSVVNCLRCSGGTAIRVRGLTPEFANYRPETGPRNLVRSVPSGHCVEWRWVTADRRFVMAKDRSVPNNQASWVFVPRTSLPSVLKPKAAVSCDHLR